MTDPLRQISEEGVAVWLDDLSRQRLVSGNLETLMRDRSVVGITTNPTIFQKAVSDSEVYAEQLRDLRVRRIQVDEATRLIMTADVRHACDVMKPAYDASGGQDGRVSIEVDPRLAYDTEHTVAEARALWWLVDRPNLFVKIPGTREGLAAITQCLSEGISINVTLIFGLPRYEEVMEAYLTGIEAAKNNGYELAKMASVASFFVSRVDTEIDKRLDKLGSEEAKALRGQAAIANARLAFQRYERVFAGPRWEALEAAGAHPQRPLWASTGVKDPAYDDTRYVIDLVTRGVVNTMPEPTLDAVADHGKPQGDTIRSRYAEAQQVLDDLAAVGIDYDDVIRVLEDEGVQKFAQSFAELYETVGTELAKKGN